MGRGTTPPHAHPTPLSAFGASILAPTADMYPSAALWSRRVEDAGLRIFRTTRRIATRLIARTDRTAAFGTSATRPFAFCACALFIRRLWRDFRHVANPWFTVVASCIGNSTQAITLRLFVEEFRPKNIRLCSPSTSSVGYHSRCVCGVRITAVLCHEYSE